MIGESTFMSSPPEFAKEFMNALKNDLLS